GRIVSEVLELLLDVGVGSSVPLAGGVAGLLVEGVTVVASAAVEHERGFDGLVERDLLHGCLRLIEASPLESALLGLAGVFGVEGEGARSQSMLDSIKACLLFSCGRSGSTAFLSVALIDAFTLGSRDRHEKSLQMVASRWGAQRPLTRHHLEKGI